MMGERMPKAAMSVIKYTLNSRDHELFKLVLLFWEVCNSAIKIRYTNTIYCIYI